MSVINSIPLIAAGDDGYQISRSVRLRSSASAYFNRTPASNGSSTTWTFSDWVKRGALGVQQAFFGSGNFSTVGTYIRFTAANELEVYYYSNTYIWRFITSAVYRDPSAWYHIVVAYDSSNATAADRMRLYVNGVRVTAFGTSSTVSLNQNTSINSNSFTHYMSNTGEFFDGYLTEVNFIDGQALTPSSFGETDSITGVWKPKKYAGTYGTNGFYLNFSDNSAATATTIGKDYSGNGNNWTPNNISVTAGVTYDSMIDVPTMYADGGNGRGNYCVINPLDNGGTTVSNANLTASTAANADYIVRSTVGMTSGKWYWEVQVGFQSTGTARGQIGIASFASALNTFLGGTATSYGYFSDNGNKYNNASAAAYGATYTTNDIIGVAFDADAGTLTFYKNNVSQGTAFTGLTSGPYFPATTPTWGFISNLNFGQRPFAYTPPTGFKALNTQNLPDATIKKGNQYFDVSLFTGTGSAQTITNSGAMQPDLVWVKGRGEVASHRLVDSVRGVNNVIYSNLTNAETSESGVVTAFNSNGFTGGGANAVTSGYAGVAWQWKESPSAGFDIVTYTGNGANRTIAHNLGVAPSLMILKCRSTTYHWPVYHRSIGPVNLGFLNLTNAYASSPTTWNSTNPTSTEFSLGTDATSNANGQTFVMYLFAEVAGFSRFGSYTGNGSADGPFCFTGFRPAFVMVKRTDAAEQWLIWDYSRNPNNLSNLHLAANSSSSETTSTVNSIDMLSNGFKQRGSDFATNASGGTYIFAAFASNPFKYSLAR